MIETVYVVYAQDNLIVDDEGDYITAGVTTNVKHEVVRPASRDKRVIMQVRAEFPHGGDRFKLALPMSSVLHDRQIFASVRALVRILVRRLLSLGEAIAVSPGRRQHDSSQRHKRT